MMKSFMSLAAMAVLAANGVAGHYIFQQFSAGSTSFPPWQYVRRNANPAWLQNGPVTDLSSTDLRCNLGGQVSNGTETITMNAGDAFTFTLDTPVYHVGPVSLYEFFVSSSPFPVLNKRTRTGIVCISNGKPFRYMSKAPGAAADYDGSGPWFKIFDWGMNWAHSLRVERPRILTHAHNP